MTTLATPADVAVPLGREITTDTEKAQITWWLAGVERVIIHRLGSVADLDAETVRYVEAEAVAAKTRRHGTAESSVTVTVDDSSVTRRYENPVTASDITDDLWALLVPTRPVVSAFTVRTRRPGFSY